MRRFVIWKNRWDNVLEFSFMNKTRHPVIGRIAGWLILGPIPFAIFFFFSGMNGMFGLEKTLYEAIIFIAAFFMVKHSKRWYRILTMSQEESLEYWSRIRAIVFSYLRKSTQEELNLLLTPNRFTRYAAARTFIRSLEKYPSDFLLTTEQWRIILHDWDTFSLEKLATSHKLPEDVYLRLAGHPQEWVRTLVANNSDAPDEAKVTAALIGVQPPYTAIMMEMLVAA